MVTLTLFRLLHLVRYFCISEIILWFKSDEFPKFSVRSVVVCSLVCGGRENAWAALVYVNSCLVRVCLCMKSIGSEGFSGGQE